MLKIEVNGLDGVTRFLRSAQKQIAFATSRALNRTAIEVQKQEIGKELPGKLKIRSQWFKPGTKYGVNIRFANKRNLEAVVGSQAPWLLLVDQGGTKHPPKKALVIPTANIDTNRRRSKRDKPKAILARKGFVLNFKKGGGGIFVRTGPGRGQIKPMYLFKSSAEVKDILEFYEAGKLIVDLKFLENFSDEFAKALITAK